MEKVYFVEIRENLDSRDWECLPGDSCFSTKEKAKAYLKKVYDEWSKKIDADHYAIREDLTYACIWDNPVSGFVDDYNCDGYEPVDFKIFVREYDVY